MAVTGPRDRPEDRPLVLLDVDGVINDLGSLRGLDRPYAVDRVPAGAFTLHIPEYMPGLIQGMCDVAEVVWCTTWEHDANEYVALILGIDPLPLLELEWEQGWKDGIARSMLWEVHEVGRAGFWIEDFEALPSDMPPTATLIDTTAEGVLRPGDLPSELQP